MARSRSGDALGASYRLLEHVGSGAVGDVWLAQSRHDGRTVAAKLLKDEHAHDPAIVERFVRERSVLLSLHHPHVVRVRDLVVEGDRLAIVMDYVPGGSLRQLLAAHGPLAPRDAVGLAVEVLEALGAAHGRQVAHRDVKPDNVLLSEPWRPGLTGAVRVTDFGIASVMGEKARMTTGLLGTPQYMAPELITTGQAGPPADVYSTGVMLYELLAGRTPFAGPGTDFTVAYRHVTAVPPRLPLPADLWSALERMLSKDPDARPSAADAAALLVRLGHAHAALGALPAEGLPEGFQEPDHPATVVRGGAAGGGAGAGAVVHDLAPDGTGTRVPGARPPAAALPDLGVAGTQTVVRRRQQTPGHARPATPQPRSRRRPAWLTPRAGLLAAVGVLTAGAVALAITMWPEAGPEPAAPPATAPVRITAHQQDPALPTGLSVSRDAAYDPETQTVSLSVTYSAQVSPLQGAFLEVVPGATEGEACPPVRWEGVTASRNQPSVTAITVDCGWRLEGVEIPARGQVALHAEVPLRLAGQDELDAWLAAGAQATRDAVSSPSVTGTAYPVQRLQDIEVRTASRTVSQTALPVTLVPVWPSGPDELNPLYVSPATGRPSQMLQDVAGGEAGVRFADGCSGALAVSSDGLTVTALAVAPSCVVRASVGNFPNLESAPFSITTRQ
ncbi:serine/threonine protein kinase [Xylanimonas oleitrophica]|uniref:non-specific serine/threonine protein kinase n=1 Tax=Xylanimonas oleitrophica TaxID=2607479 RepID=A0A2W5WRI9_9MICO|nr:serine/threonine-protein kinase [Xylanimonas oleitrophica]PZR53730.1 serine/threonine protein kinase [Xylanimonas oleitrophica]